MNVKLNCFLISIVFLITGILIGVVIDDSCSKYIQDIETYEIYLEMCDNLLNEVIHNPYSCFQAGYTKCLDGCFNAEKVLYGYNLTKPTEVYNSCGDLCWDQN